MEMDGVVVPISDMGIFCDISIIVFKEVSDGVIIPELCNDESQ